MARLKKLELSDINGEYEVTFSSDIILPKDYFEHTSAKVSIVNGKLNGRDNGGSQWYANLNVLDNNIIFSATVDPTNAFPDTFLYDINGQPTKNPQKYEGILKTIKINDNIKIFGDVKHGSLTIKINFTKK